MRPGTTSEVLDALEARGITTALLARLDFKNETAFLWTGPDELTVTGTADTTLNDNTFQPMAYGIMVSIGDNSFSTSGSEALKIALSIPADPEPVISAAMFFRDEFQSRQATIWRALMIAPPIPDVPAQWVFRRIRAGAMDSVEVSNDASTQTLTLTIEGHASLISSATNSSYLDQPKFDPTDTSNNFTASVANGSKAPSRPASGSNPVTGGVTSTKKFT